MAKYLSARGLDNKIKALRKQFKADLAAGKKNPKATIGCQDGVSLKVTQSVAAFTFRSRVDGRNRIIPLGTYPELSLAEARQKAAELKLKAKEDPTVLEPEKPFPVLRELMDKHIDLLRRTCKETSSRWMNVRAQFKWLEPLYNVRVDQLTIQLVIDKVEPLQTSDANKVAMIRSLIAALNEYRAIDDRFINRIDGMLRLKNCPFKLHKIKAKAFTADGLSVEGSGYKACKASVLRRYFFEPTQYLPESVRAALLCTALTALRIGSVLQLTWEMIDFKDGMITLPEAVMKTSTVHIVPLTPQLHALLKHQSAASKTPQGLVFCHEGGSPLHYPTLSIMVRDAVKGKVMTHGLRSSFSTFMIRPAEGYRKADRDTIERCLAHVAGNAVQNAYDGYDYFDEKKACLEEWNRYLVETQLPESYTALLK